jgi:hypothetical protein
MIKINAHKIDLLRPLDKLDDYLIVHYPLLYASRIVHVVVYGLLMLAFSLFMIHIMPIRFFRIPDTSWILLSLVLVAIMGLISYIYYHRLLAIVCYHGSEKRFYPLKATALFFVVFLLISQVVALPYVYINYRIMTALTETRLPPPRLDLDPHYPFYPQVDTLAFMNPSCSVADTGAVQYHGLPVKAQEDIVFSMGRNLFWDFPDLHFGQDSTGPWVHCLVRKGQDVPSDSLLVYYRSLSGIDSFHSEIYNCMIYSGRIGGRISYYGSGSPRDTGMRRLYFYSPLSHKYVSSDSGDIQLRLLTEKILQQDVLKEDSTPAERLVTVQVLEDAYLYAYLEKVRWEYILLSAAFFGCILAMLVLFITTFIRFFGLEVFLVGLAAPVVFLCFLAFRNTFRDALSDSYTYLLWGLVFLFALLPFLRRRRYGEIMILQIICYCVLVVVIRFPYDMYHPAPTAFHIAESPIGILTPLQWLVIPIPAAILLTAILFDKLCRVYVRPEG